MIILVEAFGDHSNRLFQNLHFEAFCLEHNIAFANATFDNMAHLYYAPPPSKTLSPLELKILKSVTFRLSKLHLPTNALSFDKEGEGNARLLLKKSRRTCYVKGWGFRVHDLTAKYQDEFIRRYALKAEYHQHNDLCRHIREIDRRTTNLIGVHIRRGDYKTFKNGKFYFSDAVYQLYMNKLDEKLKAADGKDNLFILFSNEDITINGGKQVVKSRNEWYIDQYLMSRCDYLIGPPSTFTMWASYIGKTKYFHLTDDSGNIDPEYFTYARG